MRSLDPRRTTPVTSTRAHAALRARPVGALAALAAAVALGGCSVTYPMYGGADDIKTGSIDAPAAQPRPDAVASAPLSPPPGASAAPAAPQTPAAYATAKPAAPVAADQPAITPADWAYARGALSLAMGADAVNASVPWANPDTGAYGSFSATAGTVEERGATCRPFTASHSGGGHEQRLEGNACRTAAGHWEAVAIRATASRTL